MLKHAVIIAAAMGLAVSSQAQTSEPAEIAPVATEAFHNDAGVAQVWSDANYQELLTALEGLSAHGLNPAHYNLEALQSLQGDAEARDQVATAAWLTAAAHLLYGKLDPVSIEPSWSVARREADIPSALQAALKSGEIAARLEAFAPRQPIYAAMKAELAALRESAANPQTKVPEGPALKSGMSGPRAAALQARLAELGLIDPSSADGTINEATTAAIKTFQADEGLDDDGIAGAATLRALNRGPEARIEQMRVNLERWRWLPEDLGRRHLRANIAGFEVTAFQDGEPQRTHLTIVGKPFRKTPVFSDEVSYIVFNPWWETPPSLARADKLPMFQRDPGSVSRLGFQVLDRAGAQVNASTVDWTAYSASNFPYRLRQAPGPMNALGQVKIMFPNPHNVYLHDTPTRGLFAQRQRAFSSGCLRTQDPIELSKWLLEETDGWGAAAVDEAVATGKETRANLASRVPVHILYSTIVSDGAGGVRYLDDIYQRDSAVLAGLRATPS